ncbi:glycosyltransferase family 1 protein [Brevundimonas sp. S30B]|uniref:glycosyltransferase family 4 protein n=1 Tax=unclassified Brevundimonas TaxID=2622653 RepID=UPI001071DC66|nr:MULTISPECIES: glycosyltransferase family 1 protein [unclassified Brevundimonas]QBX37275.1 glycosyltransferase family 1 protein [Brevundimonas sp. MF30-B]TFW03932.1 glycosyltransferase family 1 protein [Brevundimonas sp. S30B]
MSVRVLFDVSRLLSRTERRVPTGVDRVCLAYAEWLLDHPDVEMRAVRCLDERLVAVDDDWFRACARRMREQWSGAFFDRTPTEHEARLLAAVRAPDRPAASVISSPPATDAKPSRLRVVKQYFRSRRRAETPGGDLYFNVGHTSLNTPDILAGLQARGVRPVIMIHDLIPVTHPEFCRPGDGPKHERRVRHALTHADQILVNSAYTGHEVQAFAASEGLRAPPVQVAHLGLEPVFLSPGASQDAPPYFLHVGTIEARKNLAFLLTLWRRLEERMGAEAPRLVLIGRYGWENEAVLDHLERSPRLRGLVHQAANLPDRALSELMRGARAVLAPSAVEGFDLPAVEASAMGVPLIASDIPAHRELVPDAALIDPLDGPGWIAALESATRVRPAAPAPYVAPTWAAHFAAVAACVGLSGGGSAEPLAPGCKAR